ncbi:MAG TPA: chromosomal replication initiator protein DnaA [Acidimicrobiia bacterium]|nr:chromosomal replication initiator protein DnaA [Acidimicrobiia bacterium]
MENSDRSDGRGAQAPATDAVDDDIAKRIWEQAAPRVRSELAEATWHTWFQGVSPVRFEHDVLVLAVPNHLAAERIRSSYHSLLDDALGRVVGREIAFEILVDTSAGPSEPRPEDPAPELLAEPAAPVTTTPAQSESIWASGTLNPRYTFDQFVIGASNRFAHAAALSVAEAPAQAYNPLFIYGPAGLGKTHLLHAIGHYVRSLYPKKRVRYVSTESFMNDFVEAIRDRTRMPVFKRRYRELDVLLIDDIQFLERTQELQEEFFHTFNQIHGEGGQIVISSDRSPKSIATLEDRLRSRFEWGLLTDIQSPEFETRLAILRKKAEAEHLGGIPDEVMGFIASNIHENIRELEGALIRVAAYSSLNRAPLSEEIARSVLADLLPTTKPREINANLILDETAKMFGWTVEDLCGKSRRRPLVTARQISMYVMRELTDFSYPRIAEAFGGRDHTTVMYAVDKIRTQMAERHTTFEQVNELIGRVRFGSSG